MPRHTDVEFERLLNRCADCEEALAEARAWADTMLRKIEVLEAALEEIAEFTSPLHEAGEIARRALEKQNG